MHGTNVEWKMRIVGVVDLASMVITRQQTTTQIYGSKRIKIYFSNNRVAQAYPPVIRKPMLNTEVIVLDVAMNETCAMKWSQSLQQ